MASYTVKMSIMPKVKGAIVLARREVEMPFPPWVGLRLHLGTTTPEVDLGHVVDVERVEWDIEYDEFTVGLKDTFFIDGKSGDEMPIAFYAFDEVSEKWVEKGDGEDLEDNHVLYYTDAGKLKDFMRRAGWTIEDKYRTY